MHKKLRRIITSILAVLIAVSAPLTALAITEVAAIEPAPPEAIEAPEKAAPISASMQTDSQEGSFETALIAVKSIIDVDDDLFTEFNYSSRYSNYETMEGLIWSFNWSGSSDSKYAYMYASAAEDGTLLDFYKYTGDGRDFGLAEVNKAEALAIAGNFIKKANPETHTWYKAASDVYVSINSREYTLTFYAESNGYRFSPAQLYVRVNKFSGEVTGYNTTNFDPGRYGFEDASSVIGESEAAAAYAEKIGLSLEYTSYFNYETGELTAFPVYRFTSYYDKFISAVTGEVVEYVYDRATDQNDGSGNNMYGAAPAMAESASDSSAGGGGRASLSPAELAAAEKVSNFITGEQALQNLLETAGLEDLDISMFMEQYISLNRDYINRDRYCYNISLYSYGIPEARGGIFYGIFGRVDAETGRVLNFDMSYDNGVQAVDDESVYTQEQVLEAVKAFLNKEAPAEFAKSNLDNSYAPGFEPYNYRGRVYSYQYVRYENDIPFMSNGINVSFDPYSGRVSSYYLNWYDNITFPDVSGALPADKALSVYVEQTGSSMFYTTTGGGKAALVYQFDYSDYIDPFTGKALDYSGSLKTKADAQPDYRDIEGHWCESVVMRLLDNGVAMWSGSFEPDKTVTQLEFLQFLMLLEPYYYYGYSPAMYFNERHIDIKADDDIILTKQDAAWIITQYLGYGKLAEQPEWFVYPFCDDVDEEFKGYITICYMLGIVSGDGTGGFGAGDSITRAQAAMMLYNLILAK